MKNILLLLVSLCTASGFAQNLKIVGSKSIADPASAYMNYDKISYATVKNTSTKDISVSVVRTKNVLSTGQDTKFCWGTCFGPTTDSSQAPIVIPAGKTDTSFYAYFESNGHQGATSVTYKFYASGFGASSLDTVSASFNYLAQGAAGIDVQEKVAASIQSIYPNPSTISSVVKYKLNTNDAAGIAIYNILGVEVFQAALPASQTELVVPTQGLNEGVYFCSFYVNGKLTSSHKLVVKH